MDGIHDLGGMEGFGSLVIEQDEPVFHAHWEGRIMAMRVLMGFWRKWNIDVGRHSIECLPPADYLGFSYYEKWLASLIKLILDAGLLTTNEIEKGYVEQAVNGFKPPIDALGVNEFLPVGRPSLRDTKTEQKFAIGVKVQTRKHMKSGHNRLPGYVRGRVGKISLYHGVHVFPDTNANFEGENPQHLYGVQFTAKELWGCQMSNKDIVMVDLWENYLEPG